MACFLLPKSLCDELNKILNRYWWQKSHSKAGTHWTSWTDLCIPKAYGGLGFRDFQQFNVALLAKQGWRILSNPSSLVARILKAKYFKNTDFMHARLGSNSSYTWQSIWSARGLLELGLCWRIGDGKSVKIWEDKWLPNAPDCKTGNAITANTLQTVDELIECNTMKWKEELIHDLFDPLIAHKILEVPLDEAPCPDSLIWSLCNSGAYSVKSGHRRLVMGRVDLPTVRDQNFYSMLWERKLPTKILITLWRVFHNFIPTMNTLHYRHMSNFSGCPRCNGHSETLLHTFVECVEIRRIWEELEISWPAMNNQMDFVNSLADMLLQLNEERRDLVIIAIWAIWSGRNKELHQRKKTFYKEAVHFIRSYLLDCRASNFRIQQLEIRVDTQLWVPPAQGWLKINVDAAFNSSSKIAATGFVVRGDSGNFVGAGVKIHRHVRDAFTAETIACKMGISVAREKDWRRIILESDSLNTIKRLNSKLPDFSLSGNILDSARRECHRLSNFKAVHVCRSVNKVAHVVAKWGADRLQTRSWFETPPDWLAELLLEDVSTQ